MSLSEHEIRLSKRQQLLDMGIPPYASGYDKKHAIKELIDDHSEFRSIDDIMISPRAIYSTAGRLMLKRISGKLSFAQIQDDTGMIQIMFEHQHSKILTQPHTDVHTIMGESTKSFDYWFIDKLLEVGDRVGVQGELFITHKGERTLFVSAYQLLSKAVLPLWDKFHGIGDNEEKAYRQRYLDMIFNRETLERMKLRALFLKVIRNFYDKEWFLELNTGILGNFASWAAAAPFVTHHNDFDQDMYLRISAEPRLKMATVWGLEKVFEVCIDFRNEWSDPSHHQEFTMIEHYAAYRDYSMNMQFTEKMFDHIFDSIPTLSKKIAIPDKTWVIKEVDFTTPWQRVDYIDQIKKDSGIDVSLYSSHDEHILREHIKSKWFEWPWLDLQTTATMIDYLYKKVTRPKIIGPAFITNYPKTMQPLARPDDHNPLIVQQRQLLINGREVIKAYSELVDPVIQQENFDEQSGAVAQGDTEATKADDEFVLAMQYGMPPQSGRWMGIDRIFSLLTGCINIRDVIMFPLTRPEGGTKLHFENKKVLLVDAIKTLISSDVNYNSDTRSLNKDLADYLKTLYNYKIIVVTNASGEKLERVKYLLSDYSFDIYTLENDPSKKDSQYFKRLLQYYKFTWNCCFYIDHKQENLDSAVQSNIQWILYKNNDQIISVLHTLL